MKRCGHCGKMMVGDECQYCALMNFLKKSPSDSCENGNTIGTGKNSAVDAVQQKRIIDYAVPQHERKEPDRTGKTGMETLSIDCYYNPILAIAFNAITELCRVNVSNEGESTDLLVEAELDDSKVFTKIVHMDAKEKRTVFVEISTKILASEYVTTRNVRITISTSDKRIIHCETFTATVRPIFDINLSKVKKEIPCWVTPDSLEIKSLITSNGPVMKSMGRIVKEAYISGYQGRDAKTVLQNVAIQFKSVYDGLRDMGIRYVSDTNSYGNNLTYNYQRVRLPYKVLEDRTGNCIELACLFASVLEAMGLYPMIVFPPGHAIVGVILSSEQLPLIDWYKVQEDSYVFDFEIKDIGNGDADRIQATFVECTAICADKDYVQALESASDTVRRNYEEISKEEDYSLIVYERHFNKRKPLNY